MSESAADTEQLRKSDLQDCRPAQRMPRIANDHQTHPVASEPHLTLSILHPDRNVTVGVKNAPHVDMTLVLHVEDEMRVAFKRPVA